MQIFCEAMLKSLNWICYIVILVIAVVQDIETRKIKNELNVIGVVFGILLSIFLPDRNFWSALAGFVLLLAVGILCWRFRIFRAGDAKLLCVVGAFLGWRMGFSVFLISVLCGAVIGIPFVVVKIVKKEKELTKLPFAPAVAIASFIGLRFGYIWDIVDFLLEKL